jgi:hypothetical protein
VFFKHKYITQPTVTTVDAIVNAYHKLRKAITGIQHSKDDAQMEALERIKQAFDTANNQQAEVPRVEQTKQIEHTQPVPRLTFDKVPPPSRLVVASPKEPVVVSPETQIVTTKSLLKQPKFSAPLESDSIASRVQARHQQSQPAGNPTELIAERVARRHQEAAVANTVVDQETGQLLIYRQLLKHP